jgi:hypothetical protein
MLLIEVPRPRWVDFVFVSAVAMRSSASARSSVSRLLIQCLRGLGGSNEQIFGADEQVLGRGLSD